jgi:hypothetical protein
MMTPDRKVRKLMEEYQKTGNLLKAALRSDLDPKTARKYLKAGKLPSQMRVEHTWRTHPDPFEKHWGLCEGMLDDAPELEAKFLFEWLCREHPDEYQEGQLRTFQRRVRQWRALKGPEKEVFFPQVHEPGVRMATDCTHMDKLGVTINREPFSHMLCHCVLTCSNWEWATICHSESLLALRRGIQAAVFRLGHVPRENWTDHSSAATHNPTREDGSRRPFNQEYLDLMDHFGMTPRTIQVDSPHENGDVESLHGALKRRIKQHLLLRGSSDFESVDAYRRFLEQVLEKANGGRSERLAEELERMPVLRASRLAEYNEYRCRVRSWSTITVKRRIYSVPSRLIGETVSARRYEDRLEIYYNGVHQLTVPWISREGGHYINYRHLIGWLVRKPGAFRQYRFREELFPSDLFRWAWECLSENLSERTADREYLQLLHHAARTMQCEVEAVLLSLRRDGELPRLDRVLQECRPAVSEPPWLEPLVVSLRDYDSLLVSQGVPA